MTPKFVGNLGARLAVFATLLALPAVAQTSQIHVTLDTSILKSTAPIGSPGSFYVVGFQLADGSLSGDGNNAVFVNNVQFGGGMAVATTTSNNTASGDLSSAITLTDLNVFSVLEGAFIPGNTLSFDVSYTANLEASPQDEFVFVILDQNLQPLPTTGGIALLQIDFNAASPTIQTFSGDTSVTGGIAIPVPVVSQVATLRSISVTPANPSVTKGVAQQFTATGTFSDNSTQNLTGSVTWTSSANSVATIAAGGLATGAGVGTSTISASSGGVTGSTVLTVTAPQVAVPNVVGSTQAAATSAITGAGLVVGTVTQQSSSTVPVGSVISESPAAGTMAVVGSAVNLVISTGPAQVAVPNVVGNTQAAATSAINGAGLVVGTVTQQSNSTVPSGSVISESPAAGTMAAVGSGVNLVISTGPAQVSVPNVVGQTQAAATTAITGAGLVVGTVTQQSSSIVAAGSVISESPVAGTLVTVGSAGNLVVSTGSGQAGPPPSFIQVNQHEISSGSSVAVSFNSATKVGNTIVVYAIWDNTGGASVTDSRDDHFVSVSAPVTWGSGYSAQVFYATNIAGGTDTVTAAFATRASSFGVVYAHEYSGIDPNNPVDVTAVGSGSSSALSSGTATTTSANDLIFGAGVSDNNVSAGGSGFTTRDLAYGNITEDRTAASIGLYSATATHFGQKWGMQMVAFRPAVGGSGGGGSVAAPTFTPPAGSYTSQQYVKLGTTTAGATIYYTTDGTTPTTSSTPYTVPISVNSSLTIKAFARENGMTDSPIVSAAYQINIATGTPPAYVQVNDYAISSGASLPVTLNVPTQIGNTLVVYVIWDNAGSASITDAWYAHFVSVSPPVRWGNGYSAQIFYTTNIVGGADTITATFQIPTTSFGVIYAHEYSGISASNPIDVIASASGSSSTLNSGAATTTTANDLIFGAGVSDNNVTAAGSGFTARDLAAGNITEDRIAAAVGSYSATATHYGQQWGMQMVAFRPAQ